MLNDVAPSTCDYGCQSACKFWMLIPWLRGQYAARMTFLGFDHRGRSLDIGREPARIPLGKIVEGDQRFEQLRHVPQRDHVRPVARRRIRVRVGLDENGRYADGDRSPRQHLNELALSAG